MDEAAVLKADASTAAVQSAIQVLALDSTQRATLRLACLRKLEEVRSPATVATAQTLALDPSSSRDTNWLRTNATELLFRESTAPGSPPSSATTEAQAALAVVQAQSLDMAILVARLQRKTGGK